ncbi:hypothetical protein LUZ60_001098 [Juncus effusus]|nr:hypothetical protein LUZ60_001098 [Juncus effusus]
MSQDESAPAPAAPNGTTAAKSGDRRLRLNPNMEHCPDDYDDLAGPEIEPAVFSSLERHLPPAMFELSRDDKFDYMKEVLSRYLTAGEQTKANKYKDYRQKLISNYQPLHRELFNMNSSAFFLPSFIKAVHENSEESFRSIMAEISPGVYTFPMFQPSFCDMLSDEVQHFENWVSEKNFKIMKPNTMNKYGLVLDDFGMENMLAKLMEDFVCPISKVFFHEVGGNSLDQHHGFVVEYGKDKDRDLGFHVDDSEVTLNVCLGKQFTGGELFFRGVRCDKHVNTESQADEIFEYAHVPGQAILHKGRHRHGARATTAGHRINLLLWCRSTFFREAKKYQKDFSGWCGECERLKKERKRQAIASTKLAFLKNTSGSII